MQKLKHKVKVGGRDRPQPAPAAHSRFTTPRRCRRSRSERLRPGRNLRRSRFIAPLPLSDTAAASHHNGGGLFPEAHVYIGAVIKRPFSSEIPNHLLVQLECHPAGVPHVDDTACCVLLVGPDDRTIGGVEAGGVVVTPATAELFVP